MGGQRPPLQSRHKQLALAPYRHIPGKAGQALAQDKVSVGVFPVSSSLPYFVALEKGFFKEQNIEPEMTKLMGGPPNVAAMMTNQIEVSAVLAKNGLKDGDYTIDQLDMGQHVNAMTAGTFDGGYTLEPNASMMIKAGVARSLEAGVISKYILGDDAADAYAAGCAMTSDFIQKRPEVAKRFAAAWGKAIDYINKNPDDARKYLAKNTFTPDNVVDMVSMLGYVMAGDMSAKQMADLQKLADFGNSIGVVPEKLDVTKVLQKF